jgi:hypothetical protein
MRRFIGRGGQQRELGSSGARKSGCHSSCTCSNGYPPTVDVPGRLPATMTAFDLQRPVLIAGCRAAGV